MIQSPVYAYREGKAFCQGEGWRVQSAAIRPERSRLFAAMAGLLVLTGLMGFSLLPAWDWRCLPRFWDVR